MSARCEVPGIRNCFLDYLKGPGRADHREEQLDDARHIQASTIADHDDLRGAVLKLDGNEQDLIILHYYNGLTIRDAGRQLGLSQWQAYRLHDKALAKLAGLLDEGKD